MMTSGRASPPGWSILSTNLSGDGRLWRKIILSQNGNSSETGLFLHKSAGQPSGVDAALPDGVGDAIDGQHVGGDTVVHLVGLGVANYVLERRHHDVLQL